MIPDFSCTVGACTDYVLCNLTACPCGQFFSKIPPVFRSLILGILPLSDGGWSEWGRWSNCNISCKVNDQQHGQRHRQRTCTNPEPQNGGNTCPPDDDYLVTVEEGPCEHLYFCPVGTYFVFLAVTYRSFHMNCRLIIRRVLGRLDPVVWMYEDLRWRSPISKPCLR